MTSSDTYSFGWNFNRLGRTGQGAHFTGGATGYLTFTTGSYMHSNMQTAGSVQVDGETINSFLADCRAKMPTVQFNFSATALQYGITIDGGTNFDITWLDSIGTELRELFGFSGNLSGAAVYYSDIRPKYILRPAIANQSAIHEAYEPAGRINYSESDNGNAYSTYPDQIPTYKEWTQPFESDPGPTDTDWTMLYGVAGAPVHRPDSYTDHTKVWWTWEDALKHCRAHTPFILCDTTTNENMSGWIYKMTAETAMFDPTRVSADYDGYWSINFKCRRIVWANDSL